MAETAEYFPTVIREKDRAAMEVLEEIDPEYEFWKVLREMEWMGMDAGILERRYGTLSPGEQIRMQIAVLFAKEHAFLLIDEPTNLSGRRRKRDACLLLKEETGISPCLP